MEKQVERHPVPLRQPGIPCLHMTSALQLHRPVHMQQLLSLLGLMSLQLGERYHSASPDNQQGKVHAQMLGSTHTWVDAGQQLSKLQRSFVKGGKRCEATASWTSLRPMGLSKLAQRRQMRQLEPSRSTSRPRCTSVLCSPEHPWP